MEEVTRWTTGAPYLPRLPREYYQADAVVHWTLTIQDRRRGWLEPARASLFRELLLHTSVRGGLGCPIYCLMPDHLHLIWMGLRLDCDQRESMAFLRTHLEPALAPARFQHQAHDHVLRERDRRRNAFARVCHYIALNPVRATLVLRPEQWPYTGSLVPGYPRLHPFEEDFWARFWRIYGTLRAPNAGRIRRPGIGGSGSAS